MRQWEEAMHKAAIRRPFLTAASLAFSMSAGSAEQRGVTASEIRIGQTMPYSGPLSAYSALDKARRRATWSNGHGRFATELGRSGAMDFGSSPAARN